MIKCFTSLFVCFAVLCAQADAAQKDKKRDAPLTEEQLYQLHAKAKVRPPTGAGFYIAPISETPGRFSVSFTSTEGRTVSGMYVLSQIDIFEALLIEAKRFALTDESVGLKMPVVTRLSDKGEKGFFIDVAKKGLHSQFFITVKTIDETITIDAGTVKRGDEKSKALLYEILKRVQDVKTAGNISQ